MGKIEFGLLIHPIPRGGTFEQWRATNERLLAEAVARDLTIWITDHFQMDANPLLECLTFLAHTAGRYPTLRSGTLVLGQGYRNPAMTAKMAATLDHLTGGRFIFGIGAGWKEDEYLAYGYPYPPARTRIAQLDEALQIIRKLWTEPGPVSFAGEHYRVANAYCEPRPPRPPLVMIGGGGEQRTLRLVAQYADWWNADYYTAANYGRKLERLRELCRDIGRDPDTIVPTYYAGCSISRDPSKVIRRPPINYRPDEMFVLHGDPDAVTAQIEAFRALGVRHMQLNFLDFPRTESIDLFFEEVFPRFQ